VTDRETRNTSLESRPRAGARRRAQVGLVASYIRELSNGNGRSTPARRSMRSTGLSPQPWPCGAP
jgi:hypothetical protein